MKSKKWTSENIADQSGRTILITGSSSGLGKEAARVLAGKNATIVMAVRNTQKGEMVAGEIRKEITGAKVSVQELDLADLKSIKDFVQQFLTNYNQLDILINNAGVMMCPYGKTKDGFEIQMGTNHFGHFALTGLLLPRLIETENSRIVVTSSIAHTTGNIDFSDINWESRKYKTIQAYGDSKIANLYFAYELARKLQHKKDAPLVVAAHPGWTNTDLQRHSGVFSFLNPFFAQKVTMGTLPTLRAAVDPEARSGEYYGPDGFMEIWGYPVTVTSNKRSHNKEDARKLWELSVELTGVHFEL